MEQVSSRTSPDDENTHVAPQLQVLEPQAAFFGASVVCEDVNGQHSDGGGSGPWTLTVYMVKELSDEVCGEWL